MPTTNVSEQLLLAKSFIDTPEKWCRGGLHTHQSAFNAGTYDVGAHCTLGALQCAQIDVEWARERLFNALLRTLTTHDYVAQLIARREGPEEEEEGCWNPDYEEVIAAFNDYGDGDEPATTHDQIMQMFDAAILDAVAEELGLLPSPVHEG